MSTKCDHAERWPDGFCVVCAELEENTRRKKLAELHAQSLLDERVLELFPNVRFVSRLGMSVKVEDEE